MSYSRLMFIAITLTMLGMFMPYRAAVAQALEVMVITHPQNKVNPLLSYEKNTEVTQVVNDALSLKSVANYTPYIHTNDVVYWPAAGLFEAQNTELDSTLTDILSQLEQATLVAPPAAQQALNDFRDFLLKSTFRQRVNTPIEHDYHLSAGRLNPKLSGNYWLYLPAKPHQVWLTGALKQQQALPFAPLMNAQDYLDKTTLLNKHGLDEVWVISAKGELSTQGVAYWNKQDTYILPGDMVFVPFNALSKQLNQQIAKLLQHRVIS